MSITSFIRRVCVQTAVYWGSPTNDGYGGNSFDAPVEISCRWEGKQKLIKDAFGNEVISKAEILLTQDVDLGGYLYLGSLNDLTAEQKANPALVDAAWQIIAVDKIPMIRSTSVFVRKAYV